MSFAQMLLPMETTLNHVLCCFHIYKRLLPISNVPQIPDFHPKHANTLISLPIKIDSIAIWPFCVYSSFLQVGGKIKPWIVPFRSEVVHSLADKQKTCQEKIKTLESNKDYLERNLKESENSLRELVLQKRSIWSCFVFKCFEKVSIKKFHRLWPFI